MNYLPIIQLKGDVEIDECFIKSNPKYSKHINSKFSTVLGLIERDSKKIILVNIPDKSTNSIIPVILNSWY